jgi:hypothetical protein
VADADGPAFRGPTEENRDLEFGEPRPKWYWCEKSG